MGNARSSSSAVCVSDAAAWGDCIWCLGSKDAGTGAMISDTAGVCGEDELEDEDADSLECAREGRSMRCVMGWLRWWWRCACAGAVARWE